MKKIILILMSVVFVVCSIYGIWFGKSYTTVKINQNELYGENNLNDFTVDEKGVLTATSDDPWITLCLKEKMTMAAIEIKASDVSDSEGNSHIFDTDTWSSKFKRLHNGRNYYYFYNSSEPFNVQNLRLDLVEVAGASCCIQSVTVNPSFYVWGIGFIKALIPMGILAFCLVLCLNSVLKKDDNTVKQKNDAIYKILGSALISVFFSYFTLENLRITINSSTVFICAVIIFIICYAPKFNFSKRTNILLLIFSLALSLANNLGSRIVIGQAPYDDLIDTSYVMQFKLKDLAGILVLTFVIYKLIIFFCLILKLIQKKSDRLKTETEKLAFFQNKPVNYFLPSIIMLACWLVWLVLYYPGFIFGDSVVSIDQAVGNTMLFNQHPVVYTLFIKVCIKIGEMFGDLTFGCAVYSVVQMIVVALILGKMIEWLSYHKAPLIFTVFVTLWFSLSPFFGQMSVAMWKDPIFGVSCVWFTLNLLELFEKDKNKFDREFIKHLIKLFVSGLLVCFFRNNGFYAVIFTVVTGLIAFRLYGKNDKLFRKISVSLVPLLIIYCIITGPVYSALRIIPAKQEAGVAAILLNQMASVAASDDGVMSEDDKQFMDKLLPLEKYSSVYTPCSVDRLKNNKEFNSSYMNSNMKEFYKTYISIGTKNIGKYIDAWALMTFGYFAPNYHEFWNEAENLAKGSFWDLFNSDLEINAVNPAELPDDSVYKLFTPYGTVIPLGVVNWILIFAIVLSLIKKDYKCFTVLLLSFGIVLTLILASPYWYWPRYGSAQLYLLPIYLYIIAHLLFGKRNETENYQLIDLDVKKREDIQ